MLLEGKRAVVTGGSRGIGNAIVREFLREGGHRLRRVPQGPETRGGLSALARDGGLFVWRRRSARRNQQIVDALEKIVAETGTIEILVNNPGVTRDGLNLPHVQRGLERGLERQPDGGILRVAPPGPLHDQAEGPARS